MCQYIVHGIGSELALKDSIAAFEPSCGCKLSGDVFQDLLPGPVEDLYDFMEILPDTPVSL
jgi:hypothetical protein